MPLPSLERNGRRRAQRQRGPTGSRKPRFESLESRHLLAANLLTLDDGVLGIELRDTFAQRRNNIEISWLPATNELQVRDSGYSLDAGNGMRQVDLNTVAVPLTSINSIDLALGDGGDQFSILSFPNSFGGSVRLDGGASTPSGQTDTITVSAAVDAGTGDILLTADTITIRDDLATGGLGQIQVSPLFQLQVSDATLRVADGAMTLGGSTVRTSVLGSILETSGSGDITIEGRVSFDPGVSIGNGSRIRSLASGANAGDIRVFGRTSPNTLEAGIRLEDDAAHVGTTAIETVDGNIHLEGVGGSWPSFAASGSTGIEAEDIDGIRSSGSGAITLIGVGGEGPGLDKMGIKLAGPTLDISSVSGSIALTGTGGSGENSSRDNRGVYLNNIAGLFSTGTGTDAATITVTGVGGLGNDPRSNVSVLWNHGIVVDGGTEISSIDGDILLDGSLAYNRGSTSYGVVLQNSDPIVGGITYPESPVIRSLGTGADAAQITINGRVSEQPGDFLPSLVGIRLSDTVVTSVAGDISLQADESPAWQYGGVEIHDAQILSTGTGPDAASIRVAGGGSQFGVSIREESGNADYWAIQAVDGDLAVTGKRLSSPGLSPAVSLRGQALRATGDGDVQLEAELDGDSSSNIAFFEASAVHAAGDLLVRAADLLVFSGVNSLGGASSTGDLRLETDSASSVPTLQTAGNLRITTISPGRSIVVGRSSGLDVDVVVDKLRLVDGFQSITIGDERTGPVYLRDSTGLFLPDPTTAHGESIFVEEVLSFLDPIQLNSRGIIADLTDGGDPDLSSVSSWALAGQVSPGGLGDADSGDTGIGQFDIRGETTLAGGSSLHLQFGDGQWDQLTVSGRTVSGSTVEGTVTIEPNVKLLFEAAPGVDLAVPQGELVLLNNDGADPIVGEFLDADGNPLQDGDVLTDFLGTGMDLIVDYQGGDGNDLVLFSNEAPSISAGFDSLDLAALTAEQGFTIDGSLAFGFGSLSVSGGGDFNGDGVDDIIIGAASRGTAYVLFGGQDDDWSSANLRFDLDGSNGFAFLANNTNAGAAVSFAGDLNNDSFDDIVIGATTASPNGISRAGAAYVLYGTDQSMPATVNATALDGQNGFALTGIDASDFLGTSVSGAGDVNGDGIADLLVGAPEADPNGNSSGEAYVVFGQAAARPATLSAAALDGTNGFIIHGSTSSDDAGFSVSDAGDVNADGIGDLLIGEPGNDSAHVVFGNSSGFGAVVELNSLDGTNGVSFRGERFGESGYSVSGMGDVNGDGIDDVLIGEIDSNSRAGAAYIVFGRDSAFTSPLDLTGMDGSTGLILPGLDLSDQAGFSVSGIGDVNADGLNDFAVGAPYADPAGRSSAGEVYVFYGSDAGFPEDLDLADARGERGYTLLGYGSFDYSGSSVHAAGDFNADGIADVIVSSPSGYAVHVVYGRSSQTLISSYTEGTGPQPVLIGAINITDADDTDLSRLSVSVTADGGAVLAEDRLTIQDPPAGLQSQFDAASNTLTITPDAGAAPIASLLEALAQVRYENSSVTPDTRMRRLDITVQDVNSSGGANGEQQATFGGQFEIIAVDTPPVAEDDSLTIDEDGRGAVDVLANDFDLDSTLSLQSVGAATSGTVGINADGTVSYLPNTDFHGSDSFTYTVQSGGLTAIGTVTVTVRPVNDAPQLAGASGGIGGGMTRLLADEDSEFEIDHYIVTPDGRHLVYWGRQDNKIYSVATNGQSAPKLLGAHDGGDVLIRPRLTPDGSRVIYVTGDSQLVSVPVPGGAATVLHDSSSQYDQFEISPDGGSVIFSRHEGDTIHLLSRVDLATNQVSVLSELEVFQLPGTDRRFDIASNGRVVFYGADYSSTTDVSGLISVPAGGGDERVLYQVDGPSRLHDFVLAGERVVYRTVDASSSGTIHELFAVAADGSSTASQLSPSMAAGSIQIPIAANLSSGDFQPGVSADHSYFVNSEHTYVFYSFDSTDPAHRGVYRASLEGSEVLRVDERLYWDSVRRIFSFTSSADGSYLINEFFPGAEAFGLETYFTDGSPPVGLTLGYGGNLNYVLSNVTNQVIYQRNNTDDFSEQNVLYSIPALGGTPVRLTPEGLEADDEVFAFLPDGQTVVFADENGGDSQLRQRLYAVSTAGGPLTPLSDDNVVTPGTLQSLRVQADGSQVFFVNESAADIFVVTIDAAESINGLRQEYQAGTGELPLFVNPPGISDVDDTQLSEVRLRIASGYEAGADRLTIDAGPLAGAISVVPFDEATATIVLSGLGTIAEYQHVLSMLNFVSDTRSDNPPPRVISMTVVDANGSGADNGPQSITGSGEIEIIPQVLIEQITINDGDAQRSNIESISVQFSQDVNLPELIATGEIVDVATVHGPSSAVSLAANAYTYDAATRTLTVDLSIDGLGGSRQTVLADGRYELRLDTRRIHLPGLPASTLVDDDGLEDATRRIAFHRLRGDFDGSATVDLDDLDEFFTRFGGYVGSSRYDFAFDLNGDGVINLVDAFTWLLLLNRAV